jgi:hypothetical protein
MTKTPMGRSAGARTCRIDPHRQGAHQHRIPPLPLFVDRPGFAEAVRRHRDIENNQHWVLDVRFGEDANRARKDHSAENPARIRRMALNAIRQNGPSKDSLRRRKKLFIFCFIDEGHRKSETENENHFNA